jgi:hypothetical protein
MFLTAEELHELTGYTRGNKQIEWLRGRAYPFEIAADGRARVLRAAVLARLGGEGDTSKAVPKLRLQ